MKRILHIITGLSVGGAEMMLYKLLSNSDRLHFQSEVISLTDFGVMGQRISGLGVPVHNLGMDTGQFYSKFRLLRGMISDSRPQVIQTWMYHANLIGGLAGASLQIPIVWNLRAQSVVKGIDSHRTRAIAYGGALLSWILPKVVVSCSQRAILEHKKIGYCGSKMVFIPNGFDLESCRPNEEARSAARMEMGLLPNETVMGMVAKFDKYKDHSNLFKALGELKRQGIVFRLVLCGEGITLENRELMGQLESQNLVPNVLLLGFRQDIPSVVRSFDFFVLPSCSNEGFPNVVGEAMSCGVPCIVTDVGDAAFVVGSTGGVVPPKNPGLLASKIAELLGESLAVRRSRGIAARAHIEENYSVSKIVRQYEGLYSGLVDGGLVPRI